MSNIKFNDGVQFDTSGSYRVVWRKDGYYVVGKGLLAPVNDYQDGCELIRSLTPNSKTEEDQT